MLKLTQCPKISTNTEQDAIDHPSTPAHVNVSAIQDHLLPLLPFDTTLQAGETSKPSQHAARNRPPKITSAPKAFAFVNITDPAESANTDRRKFVRQYVRPVKDTKKDKDEESRIPRVTAVGLATGSLPFIVMSHPDQGSTAGTKKFVKQNAQKKFRKKGKGKSVEDIDETILRKETKLALTTKDGNFQKLRTATTAKNHRLPRIVIQNEVGSQEVDDHPRPTSIWNYLDSSAAIFPIKMASTDYRLVEYLHTSSETTKIPPAFMPLWFSLILKDKASFQGLLSLALNHQLRCHKLPTEHSFRHYHSAALQSIRQRLADATQHTSPGLVTSVLILLVHDILCEDEVRYKINRDGLRSIIALRGGIASIDNFFDQRIMLLVVEVCGAITFNCTPEYYMPNAPMYSTTTISPLPSSRLQSLCQIWHARHPERTQVMDVLLDHYAVNAGVIAECPDLWKRPGSLSPPIYLVIIRYLYIINHLDPAEPAANIEISFCISAIIYLNVLRDAIGDYFTCLSHSLVARLMDAVFTETDEWLGLEPARLWCLVQGGVVSSGEDRIRFLDVTRKVMRVLKCRSWDNATEIMTDIMHVEQLFEQKYEEFGNEVMSAWT